MHETFKAKQEWLKRVKRSKTFNHATKTFAWCVMDHMYGDKTVSNPGGALIKSETNIAPNKQGAHRKALSEAGALSCALVKNDRGDWDSYEYTLNLDWEGSTPHGGSTPEGNTLPPTGEQGAPQKGTHVPPTGEPNLSRQSIKESKKQSIRATTVSGEPVEVEGSGVREEVESLPNVDTTTGPSSNAPSRGAAEPREKKKKFDILDSDWEAMYETKLEMEKKYESRR